MTAAIFLSGPAQGGDSPLGNVSMLRLLRLARLTRILKMLRSMPELLILVKGMLAASRSVMFTVVLLAGLLYVYAIVFTSICGGTEIEEEFKTVPHSMYTLFMVGTLLDS